MIRMLTCCIVAVAALMTHVASAAPINLKFAFVSSDRSSMYLSAVKPFVDAVNNEGKGLIEIEVLFSRALGQEPNQEKLILDGRADFAFVIPGYSRDRFPDLAAIELPGLFKNVREATLVHTRLATRYALKGYNDFVVVGAFASAPESIHVRAPIASLADLKGKTIRVNNELEGAGLEKLGIKPVFLPINKVTESISKGEIDGTAVPPPMLIDFGIGRVATSHYMLSTGSAPLAILMNRNAFDRLPKEAQDIVRKYSGDWLAERFIQSREAATTAIMKRIEADPRRKVVFPSPPDLERASIAFRAVRDDFAKANARNAEMLRAVEAELSKVRASN